jgi:hypothetical protein
MHTSAAAANYKKIKLPIEPGEIYENKKSSTKKLPKNKPSGNPPEPTISSGSFSLSALRVAFFFASLAPVRENSLARPIP